MAHSAGEGAYFERILLLSKQAKKDTVLNFAVPFTVAPNAIGQRTLDCTVYDTVLRDFDLDVFPYAMACTGDSCCKFSRDHLIPRGDTTCMTWRFFCAT